jgi:4-alpha-glucanotransferase
MSDALRDLAARFGIHPGFHDLGGTYRPAVPETLYALLWAMGQEITSEAEAAEALADLRADETPLPSECLLTEGQPFALPCPPCEWSLSDETGAEAQSGRAEGTLDIAPLPFGYYTLTARGEGWEAESFLLCRPAHGAPEVADLLGAERAWGICGALYGLRSKTNGGIGSYEDLQAICATLGGMGARFFGINPIHALGWTAVEMLSPYSPTHRGYWALDHIALPGMGPTPEGALIDYAEVRPRHREALERAYSDFTGSTFFDDFLKGQPDVLEFASFEALSERFGDDFRTWPEDLQRPGTKAVMAAGERTRFHAWLQWMAETQLDAAAETAREKMGLGLYLDLAVGPRPGGAEVWMNPATVAKGVSIGAPPDHLNPEGQAWNLAAHAPEPLRANRYQPLRAMLAKLMKRAGVLRVDHALGLYRSYWQPTDGSPGGYISQPFESFLAVISIEARRAGCLVIGEDLGLVPDGFRETMNGAGLLSYAVWQFENALDGTLLPPEHLRSYALSCLGTHDTPTAQGFWYGTDIDWWRRMGWQDARETAARHDLRSRQRAGLRDQCGIPFDARGPQIAAALHRRLLQGPTALIALQLDDLLGQVQAQNLPGTVHEHPNWRRRTPVPIETLESVTVLRDTLPRQD